MGCGRPLAAGAPAPSGGLDGVAVRARPRLSGWVLLGRGLLVALIVVVVLALCPLIAWILD